VGDGVADAADVGAGPLAVGAGVRVGRTPSAVREGDGAVACGVSSRDAEAQEIANRVRTTAYDTREKIGLLTTISTLHRGWLICGQVASYFVAVSSWLPIFRDLSTALETCGLVVAFTAF
jgi:hypothetical protein